MALDALTSSVVAGLVAGLLTALVGGFFHSYIWARFSARRKSRAYLHSIKQELETCKERMTGKGNRVPTHVWQSVLSAGLLDILPEKARSELTMIYDSLEIHNYTAEVAYQTGTQVSLAQGAAAIADRWHKLSDSILEREKRITGDVDRVFKESWWP